MDMASVGTPGSSEQPAPWMRPPCRPHRAAARGAMTMLFLHRIATAKNRPVASGTDLLRARAGPQDHRPAPAHPGVGLLPFRPRWRCWVRWLLGGEPGRQGRPAGGGTGQSLMQSQRLAKSVSQALVGSPQAFPDVRESSDVLAKTVRGLKSGDDSLRLAPVSEDLQPDVEKSPPDGARREERQDRDGQQKILTQVGNALRTINRQSSDLLEIAETVSSLKLQQNAAPAEISAAGQLVMLTQRIGKSANEFLTMEGVSPEAVFLLGKDLNSFKEIAQGLLEGSPELRLAGSKDRKPASAWTRCWPSTNRPARRPAPFWATCRAWCPRVKRSLRSLPTANRCAVAGRPAGQAVRADRPGRRRTGPRPGAAFASLLCARPWPSCRCRTASSARRCGNAAPGSRRPGAGSQARQRRQPGRHFAPDERTADGG
jgi:hypothetical protein